MTDRARTFIRWSPRIAGLIVAGWLSIFALDAFTGTRSFLAEIPGFLLHLVPSLALLGVVYIAWRRPWFGALVFVVLAAVYVLTAGDRWTWIVAIGGPLALVGLLYVASWQWMRRHPAP